MAKEKKLGEGVSQVTVERMDAQEIKDIADEVLAWAGSRKDGERLVEILKGQPCTIIRIEDHPWFSGLVLIGSTDAELDGEDAISGNMDGETLIRYKTPGDNQAIPPVIYNELQVRNKDPRFDPRLKISLQTIPAGVTQFYSSGSSGGSYDTGVDISPNIKLPENGSEKQITSAILLDFAEPVKQQIFNAGVYYPGPSAIALQLAQ